MWPTSGSFLQEGTFPEHKALIRNFVKGIEIKGDGAVLTYTIPIPNEGLISESASILEFVQSDPPKEARIARKGRGARDHRAPNHISKTVLSTMHVGGPECTVLRTFRWELLI